MVERNHILYLTALACFVALPVFAQDVRVCIGSKVVYAANGLPGSIYEYNLSQTYAGEIIQTHNDSIIVEWGVSKGIFQIGVRETTMLGCMSAWAFLDVEVVGEYAQFTQPVYSICSGNGVYVDFNKSNFVAWDWADQSISPDGYITKPGRYELITIDHNNCRLSSFIDVVHDQALQISLGADTMICSTEFTLYALNTQNNPAGTIYTWSTGESGEFLKQITVDNHNMDQNSTYWVRAEFNGCVVSDTVTVLQCKETEVEDTRIPNTFTPNDDGDNDVWNIWLLRDYPNSVVEVFDRWGRRVFISPRGYPVPWDGRDSSGRFLPMETYYYIIHLNDGSKEPIIGTITIIR